MIATRPVLPSRIYCSSCSGLLGCQSSGSTRTDKLARPLDGRLCLFVGHFAMQESTALGQVHLRNVIRLSRSPFRLGMSPNVELELATATPRGSSGPRMRLRTYSRPFSNAQGVR